MKVVGYLGRQVRRAALGGAHRAGLGTVHIERVIGQGRGKVSRRRPGARRGQRGIAAIEAALVLPLVAFTIVGFIELYQYFRAVTILDRASFTLANGLSVQRELFDMRQCDRSDDICTYGAITGDLLRPLDYAQRGQVIFSVYAANEPGRNGTVNWIQTPSWQRAYRPGTEGGSGSAVAASRLQVAQFPPANQGDTIIAVELFYDHEPFVMSSAFWEALGGPRRVYSRAFFRPRFSDIRTLTR